MLRIQRKANAKVIFILSGRIELEDVEELRRLFDLEDVHQRVVLDLNDVTLLDREAVKFLARCEANGMELQNCPAYIREWIEKESDHSSRTDSDPKRSDQRHGH